MNELILNSVRDEELSPVLPEAGGILSVKVSYIADNGLIYFQIPNHAGYQRLEILMKEIEKHFSKGSRADEFVSNPQTGKLVIARYSVDNGWYRAEIKQIFPDVSEAEVYFVDYGNSEVVDFTALRSPDKCSSHMSLPYQAIESSMYGVPPENGTWTSRAIQRLSDLIATEEPIDIKVASTATDNTPAEVSFFIFDEVLSEFISVGQTLLDETDLFNDEDTSSVSDEDGGVNPDSVADALNKIKLDSNENRMNDSTPSTPSVALQSTSSGSTPTCNSRPVHSSSSTDTTPASNRQRKSSSEMALPDCIDLPPVNEFMAVHVMWTCDPGNFTCILFENSDSLLSVMGDIQKFYSSAECIYTDPPYELEPRSQLYAALSDGMWYRVMIRSVMINIGKASALFVDFGHFEAVNLTDIRPLHPTFRHLPQQAFRAGLYNIAPVGDSWTTEAEQRFSELTLDRDLQALVRGRKDNRVLVSLVDTSKPDVDVCIDEVLLKERLVKLVD